MLGKKVAVATTVLMIGTVIANVIGFASMIIVARHLAPEDFGLAITALAIVLIIGALTDLPVSTSLYHLKTPSDDDFNTAWTLSLLRGLVAMLVLLAMAYPLSALYEDARLVPLIAALSVMPLGFSLRSMYFERYAMDLNFTPSIVERVFQKLASALTAIAIATTTASYWAIPVSMIVASFASLLITYVYAPRLPRLSLKSFKAIFGYSIWLSLAGMFNAITWRIEILTAGKLIGPAGAGYIGLGAQFTSRFREFAVGPIRQSLFSAFSKMQEDPARLRVAYGASMATSLALLAPIGVGMSLLSGSIMTVVFGEKWAPASIVLAISGISFALSGLFHATHPLAMSLGRTRALFKRDVALFFIKVPIVIVGGYFGGLPGLMLGGLVAAFAHAGIAVWQARAFIGFAPLDHFRLTWRTWAALAAMCAAVLAADAALGAPIDTLDRALALGLEVAAGGGAYVAAHLGLWLLVGRPDGAEARLLGIARSGAEAVLRKVRGARSAA